MEEGERAPLLPKHESDQNVRHITENHIQPEDQKCSTNEQADQHNNELCHSVIVHRKDEVVIALTGSTEEGGGKSLDVGEPGRVEEEGRGFFGGPDYVEEMENGQLEVGSGNVEDDCEAPRWLALAAGGVPMVGISFIIVTTSTIIIIASTIVIIVMPTHLHPF